MIESIDGAEPDTVRRLVELDSDAFGAGGLNIWHMVPIVRHGRVFGIRHGGELVGAVQYLLDWTNRRKAYIIGISISREHRGLRLGTALLTESLKALAGEDIDEVELTVSPHNRAAVHLYEKKLGFRRSGCLPAEYGEGEDRLLMTKVLS